MGKSAAHNEPLTCLGEMEVNRVEVRDQTHNLPLNSLTLNRKAANRCRSGHDIHGIENLTGDRRHRR